MNRFYHFSIAFLSGLFMSAAAFSQVPTFSLEAVAVNGGPLTNPTANLQIGPGERVTAKVFLRDWSPNGEILRAYQAELNPDTFTSGSAGWVKPVGLDEKRTLAQENRAAAFIDDKDPQYVHAGLHIIPITDTLNAPGYRWLTVLLRPDEGPVAKQDGKKFYLGTLELEASPDAAGEFKIAFVEDPHNTGLLDLANAAIIPVEWEPLVLNVRGDVVRLFIKSSEPPNKAIDARRIDLKDPRPQGAWDTIRLTFSADPKGVGTADFAVSDGSKQPPAVRNVSVDGMDVTVTLSSPVRPGAWSSIAYVPTGSRVTIGSLPGDVNNDSQVDLNDVTALVDLLNQRGATPLFQTDIDRDGRATSADLVALVDLVTPVRGRGTARLTGMP